MDEFDDQVGQLDGERGNCLDWFLISTVYEFYTYCYTAAVGRSVVKGAFGSFQIKTLLTSELPKDVIGFTAEENRKWAGCEELFKNRRKCKIETERSSSTHFKKG